MHIDAEGNTLGSQVEGDICIVGAGAAGVSIALQWINTPYKVMLLEEEVSPTKTKSRTFTAR
ncbi:MAG: FAD-binding oxidoreductase [Sphingobacterium sp.]|nr:FAD-binding oxidoreductase [Sphingobacterium sp.]